MIDPPRPAYAQQTVVCLPAQIDIVNSQQVREKLAAVALAGVTTVIADMTRTVSCDGEGAYSLAQAHRQLATHHNVQLRLAAPSAKVRAVFAKLGLDDLVHLYPNLDAALAPGPAPLPVTTTSSPSSLTSQG
jgi:anti-anti-sigma factor